MIKAASQVALSLSLVLGAAMALPGCSTAPATEEGKETLTSQTTTAQDAMYKDAPGLQDFVNHADGYAIFPSVGKGGIGVGGAYGRGEVYEHGQLIGFADLSQGSIGLQLGGQTFSELIVFETSDALQHFKDNKLAFAANASAVAIKSGAAAAAKYENGVAVFVRPEGGAMFEASVGGQQFSFQQSNTAPQPH